VIEHTLQAVTSPGGHSVILDTRDGTNDANIAVGLNGWQGMVSDEYRMRGRTLSGWAIDIGAHIGGLAIPLALDHPALRVVAVEGVPENVEILADNVRRNITDDRVTVLNAFAAAPGTASGVCHYGYRSDPSASDGYISAHRFVGGTWGARGQPEFSPVIEAVSLDDLLARFEIEEVALLKIDCEGCEWAFLDTPAVAKVQIIVGEYHGGTSGVENPQERLVALLGPTHDVAIWDPTATVGGLFEAVRR
jgi:FkbM family methyltransferase